MTDVEKLALADIWARYRPLCIVVITSSVFLNLIVFSSSLYMMMVYDSVLPSGSFETLWGLFLILIILYLFQALFEAIRGEAMLSIANSIHSEQFHAVHFATTQTSLKSGKNSGDGMQLIRDLDQVHGFFTSQGPIALLDLPWVLLFLIILTMMHWSLGLTALVGTIVLLLLAGHTNRHTASGTKALGNVLGARAAATMDELRFVETASAMGMRERLLARSSSYEDRFVNAQSFLSRTTARLGSAGRIFRMLLQSALLTVGALLVIKGYASGGVMLAASILSGRALAPIDITISNWRNLSAARTGWARIHEATDVLKPPEPRSVSLAPPSGILQVNDLWLIPPGSKQTALGGASFSLEPGTALAIIGPSAAGKTSLAKALVGIWPASRGEIRIGGATYDQWNPEVLGSYIGYVPQAVDLLNGTIGENICRFDPSAPSDAIIAAAKAASMHETILGLPNGYDTRISATGGEISAGQRQRLGLARALYGEPYLIVLDEANSNLDASGDDALASAIEAIKARQGIIVMITHRPLTLNPATHVAFVNAGRLVEFGPRDEVLTKLGIIQGKTPVPVITKPKAGVT